MRIARRVLWVAVFAAALSLGGDGWLSAPVDGWSTVTLSMSQAEAQRARRSVRRTARRTARRTSARMNYRQSLPGGCVRRRAYYYCGGLYYEPVVQGGQTVYVVVNP